MVLSGSRRAAAIAIAAALIIGLAACAAPAPARPSDLDRRLAELDRMVADGLADSASRAAGALRAEGIDHPQLAWAEARLAFARSEWAAAAQTCERLIALAPGWVEPRILLARAYQGDGRAAAAASVFADIDRLAPQSPWGPYGQAAHAIGQQRWADAVRLAEAAIARAPAFAPALRLRAMLAQRDGDPAAEERWLLRLTDHDPADPAAWWRLGELAAAAGRQLDADAHRDRAWRLDPDPDRARRLADEAQTAGDAPTAARWRRRAEAP